MSCLLGNKSAFADYNICNPRLAASDNSYNCSSKHSMQFVSSIHNNLYSNNMQQSAQLAYIIAALTLFEFYINIYIYIYIHISVSH